MYAIKFFGSRFYESRKSRNEHFSDRNGRFIICRCYRSLKLYGKEHITLPRFKKGSTNLRSKYRIRIY